MLGVVVWAAKKDSTAIVWCEDQGDLAFLEMHPHSSVPPHEFGEGDLIQFDLAETKELRVAHNPRRIAQHYCVGLDDVVAKASAIKAQQDGPESAPMMSKAPDAGASSNVIDFAAASFTRRRSVA